MRDEADQFRLPIVPTGTWINHCANVVGWATPARDHSVDLGVPMVAKWKKRKYSDGNTSKRRIAADDIIEPAALEGRAVDGLVKRREQGDEQTPCAPWREGSTSCDGAVDHVPVASSNAA